MNRPSPLVPGAGALLTSMSLQVPFQGLPICLTAHKAARASIASSREDRAEGKPVEVEGGTEMLREAAGLALWLGFLGSPCPDCSSSSGFCNTPLPLSNSSWIKQSTLFA